MEPILWPVRFDGARVTLVQKRKGRYKQSGFNRQTEASRMTRRWTRTDARKHSLGRPGSAEGGECGSVLSIAGFDPRFKQATGLDINPAWPGQTPDPQPRDLHDVTDRLGSHQGRESDNGMERDTPSGTSAHRTNADVDYAPVFFLEYVPIFILSAPFCPLFYPFEALRFNPPTRPLPRSPRPRRIPWFPGRRGSASSASTSSPRSARPMPSPHPAGLRAVTLASP